METCCNGLHEWSAAKEGSRLSGKGTSEGPGGGDTSMREASECMELCLGMDDELSVSTQARIREQTSTGDTVVREHLLQGTWPGNQVDEALYRQGAATSHS